VFLDAAANAQLRASGTSTSTNTPTFFPSPRILHPAPNSSWQTLPVVPLLPVFLAAPNFPCNHEKPDLTVALAR
jgi:hypothetical protein